MHVCIQKSPEIKADQDKLKPTLSCQPSQKPLRPKLQMSYFEKQKSSELFHPKQPPEPIHSPPVLMKE